MDIRTRTVGDIVKNNFSAARIFKNFGIDYCCGGSIALVDACRTAGVDVDRLQRGDSTCPCGSAC